MKTLIVCQSVHHGNTRKIAEVMAKELKAKLVSPSELTTGFAKGFDLIGFGSGVYVGKFHKQMINLVEQMVKVNGARAFVFSTSGMGETKTFNIFNKDFSERLNRKGFEVLGCFNCPGWDTFSIFRFIGGLNKRRPNKNDLQRAAKFANEMKSLC